MRLLFGDFTHRSAVALRYRASLVSLALALVERAATSKLQLAYMYSTNIPHRSSLHVILAVTMYPLPSVTY
jgi:hypothetical protein